MKIKEKRVVGDVNKKEKKNLGVWMKKDKSKIVKNEKEKKKMAGKLNLK